ncbi:group III truncated hemoglobin [Rhinopithecimicrobium faecis]
MLTDISTPADIETLVNHFYGKVLNDSLLADIFKKQIGNNWEVHLKKMVSFWHTLLLNEQHYFGSPFMAHADLPIKEVHFKQWMSLFNTSVDALFEGPKAEEAKDRAAKMAAMFQHKLAYYASHNKKPLL